MNLKEKKSKVQNKHVPREKELENRLDEKSKKLLQRAMEIAVISQPKTW